MLLQPKVQIASFALILFHLSQASAFSCSAFDLKVQKKEVFRSKGISKGAALQPEAPRGLGFARDVASDAAVVYSDAPLFSLTMGDGRQGHWKLDTKDTYLSQQQTMLEFLGYFRDFLYSDNELSGQNPFKSEEARNKFLSKDVMEAFTGLSIMDLVRYPATARVEQVNGALQTLRTKGILKATDLKDPVQALKTKMEHLNNAAETGGYPHFSRPAYLTSKLASEKYGSDATLLACTTVAYGVDMFENENLSFDELKKGPHSVLRSSIIDGAAALALIEAKKKEPKLDGFKMSFDDKGVSCQLKEAKDFELSPSGPNSKCIDFDALVLQRGAVVRRGPSAEHDQRFIQVGRKLFDLNCRNNSSESGEVNITDWSMENTNSLDQLLTGVFSEEALQNSKLGASVLENRQALINPKAKDKAFYKTAARECDNLIRAGDTPKDIQRPRVSTNRSVGNGTKANGDNTPVVRKPAGQGVETHEAEVIPNRQNIIQRIRPTNEP